VVRLKELVFGYSPYGELWKISGSKSYREAGED